MNDNVVQFPGQTVGSIPPEQIVEQSKSQNLKEVLVIGWTPENELYISSSTSNAAELLLLLKLTENELLSIMTLSPS